MAVTVSMFAVAVSALCVQVLALRKWRDLENFGFDSSQRCSVGDNGHKLGHGKSAQVQGKIENWRVVKHWERLSKRLWISILGNAQNLTESIIYLAVL